MYSFSFKIYTNLNSPAHPCLVDFLLPKWLIDIFKIYLSESDSKIQIKHYFKDINF